MSDIVKKRDRSGLGRSLAAMAEHGARSPKSGSSGFWGAILPTRLAESGMDLSHPALALILAMADPARFEAAAQAASAESLAQSPADAIKAASGGALPSGLGRLGSARLHGSLLHACAQDDLWRQAGSLLSRGLDATFFQCGVTPVGLAAYCGCARTLAEMGAYGADLRLELRAEHVPHDLNAQRSTLLHRVALRDVVDGVAIGAILAGHEQWYPDLLCETNGGTTPLQWIHDRELPSGQAFETMLLESIARREALCIGKGAASPDTARRGFAL